MSGSLYTRSTKSMLFCSHHSFFLFRYARNSFGESIKRLGKIQIKVAASSGLIQNSAKMLRLCLISAKDCCSNIGDFVNNSFISSALTFSKFASAVISVGDKFVRFLLAKVLSLAHYRVESIQRKVLKLLAYPKDTLS